MRFLYGLLSFFSRTANLLAFILLIIAGVSSWVNPDYFWPLGLFGLAYPYIALLNIFFIVSWLIRKRWFFLFSLLGLGLTYPQWRAQMALPILQKNTELPVNLRVMSYNVRNFDLYNWSQNVKSRQSMFDTISAYSPDILMLQEYYTDPNGFDNDKSMDSLGYKYHQKAVELVKNKNREWGVVLFSKYPILESGEIIRQQTPSPFGFYYNRGVYADIKVHDRIIRFVTVHLQSIYLNNEDYNNIQEIKEETTQAYKKAIPIIRKLGKAFVQRGIQSAELRAFIEDSPYPVVIGGDFNDTPGSYAYQHISYGLDDAFLQKGKGIGKTYNGKIPMLRIDYILKSEELTTINFFLVKNRNSDHFPIVADFHVPALNNSL